MLFTPYLECFAHFVPYYTPQFFSVCVPIFMMMMMNMVVDFSVNSCFDADRMNPEQHFSNPWHYNQRLIIQAILFPFVNTWPIYVMSMSLLDRPLICHDDFVHSTIIIIH